MIFYRYELYQKNNPKDLGFIKGLKKSGISEDEEDILLSLFNKELAVTSSIYYTKKFKGFHITSYFTEEGNNYFNKSIEKICKSILDKNKGYYIKKSIVDMEIEDVVYMDKYQALLYTPTNSNQEPLSNILGINKNLKNLLRKYANVVLNTIILKEDENIDKSLLMSLLMSHTVKLFLPEIKKNFVYKGLFDGKEKYFNVFDGIVIDLDTTIIKNYIDIIVDADNLSRYIINRPIYLNQKEINTLTSKYIREIKEYVNTFIQNN